MKDYLRQRCKERGITLTADQKTVVDSLEYTMKAARHFLNDEALEGLIAREFMVQMMLYEKRYTREELIDSFEKLKVVFYLEG